MVDEFVVVEELDVRVVDVARWIGWINRGETVVETEWEAYVVNAATRMKSCR